MLTLALLRKPEALVLIGLVALVLLGPQYLKPGLLMGNYVQCTPINDKQCTFYMESPNKYGFSGGIIIETLKPKVGLQCTVDYEQLGVVKASGGIVGYEGLEKKTGLYDGGLYRTCEMDINEIAVNSPLKGTVTVTEVEAAGTCEDNGYLSVSQDPNYYVCASKIVYGKTCFSCVAKEGVTPPGTGTVCPQDVAQCPDGSYLSRKPSQNCQFDYGDCPSVVTPPPVTPPPVTLPPVSLIDQIVSSIKELLNSVLGIVGIHI